MSPIFPAVPEAGTDNPLANARFIAFFCPDSALEFIGKQVAPVQQRLWFSHGLASAIMFCQEERQIEELIADKSSALSAYEVWQVAPDGHVTMNPPWLRPATVPDVGMADYSSLTKDAQHLLQEIETNLQDLLRGAAQFLPQQIPKLQRVIAAVNQIISELAFFQNPLTQPVPGHLKAEEPKLKSDAAGLHRRVNQGLTQLIQLNSSLVYTVSQAFHGAVPILEHRSLIAPYSLLGTGTAYRALSALSGYIEDVFEKHPVLKSIDFTYRQGHGFEVFPLVFRYRVEEWRATGLSLQIVPGTEPVKPKLAYYSARLGFGESHFSITAAMQVLHAADSVRWSLMTLTHELLHAHVTGLLATILGESEQVGVSERTFEQQYEAFKAACMAARGDKPCKPPTPTDSLRFIAFAFASARRCTLEQLQEPPDEHAGTSTTTLNVGPADTIAEFKREFRSSLRLLEEIIVHTLDIRYFYAGDQDLFLKLLWESWTTVPAVVGDLDTYLLRSIAAVASLDSDTVPQRRFDNAVARLSANLTELISAYPTNQFLIEAKHHLTTKKPRLSELFRPTIYAADMAALFLYSKKIESAFWSGDPNIDTGETNRLGYTLQTGDFSHGKVTNPIPFLADRLRRDATDHGNLDEDFRSAWLLLAAASATP
jgi:hypothetical protein